MTVWILSYLLTGFVIHWFAVHLLKAETSEDWRWELAATILWPIAVICGIILVKRDRKAAVSSTVRGDTALDRRR